MSWTLRETHTLLDSALDRWERGLQGQQLWHGDMAFAKDPLCDSDGKKCIQKDFDANFGPSHFVPQLILGGDAIDMHAQVRKVPVC